jgi:hypothetical protein
MRNEGGNLTGIDGLDVNAPPETEAMGAGMVADEVEGDAGEPGGYGAVAAEAGTRVPGAEKGLLSEGLGEIGVAERNEEETEDARAMGFDDGGEIVKGRGEHSSLWGFEEVRG